MFVCVKRCVCVLWGRVVVQGSNIDYGLSQLIENFVLLPLSISNMQKCSSILGLDNTNSVGNQRLVFLYMQ